MAEGRQELAGDLGAADLRHDVVVHVPEGHAPVVGTLLRVSHGIASQTGEPFTVIALEGESDYPWGPPERVASLHADWVVTVA